MLIYIVDDNFEIVSSIGKWLHMKYWDVRAFSHSQPLYETLSHTLPDIILLDIRLGNEDGRQVCKYIRNLYDEKVPIILFSSAYSSMKQLKDTCADGFIAKGTSLRELTEVLKQHVKVQVE